MLLNENQLNKLISNNGASIIYSHLGRYDISRPISDEIINSFKLLKRYSEKDIWNTNVSTLLNYIRIRKYLKYNFVINKNKIVIYIDVDEPIKDFPLNKNDFKFITFYTPNPENTFIIFRGELLKTRINPSDDNKKSSITII